MPRRLAFLAVFAALTAAPALADTPPPAPPATPLAVGRCLWESLPTATRDALVASGPSIDDISKALGGLNPALIDVARAQCPRPVTEADAQKATEAWTSLALSSWAQVQLARQDKVTSAALTAAWAKYTPAERAKFSADEDKPPETERANVAPLAQALGVTTPNDIDVLAFWVLCRLHLDAMGG
jgi:hypothetical protein